MSASARRSSLRRPVRISATNRVLLVLFVALVLLFGSVVGAPLFRLGTLRAMALQVPQLGLLSLAMMVALLSGGLDLSIIAVADFSALVSAYLLTHIPEGGGALAIALQIGALCCGLLVAALIGALNGLIIAYLDVSPILTTLGTMTMIKGLSVGLTHGGVISGFPPLVLYLGNANLLGIPVPLLILLLIAWPVAVMLNRSPFGNLVAMIGSNIAAVRYSGVDTRWVLVRIYVLSGLLAGLAGVIMMARFNSANAAYGESFLLVTVLAAVLGGVDPSGGFGKVSGLLIALAILQLISTGFNLLGLSEFLTLTIWGVTLVAISGLGVLRQRYPGRRRTLSSTAGRS
ncbi:ABC transporter permease [Lichenicoccus sp.]|uniref:ABC transporter permease n=1 Tax=Lichenicoccus sp. TaxID=2781899 RepID=UPI003D1326A3